MNKKGLFLSVLLFALFAFSGTAYPWGSTGGDGTRYSQVQEVGIFYNNSGATITTGMIVLNDTTGTAGSSLGSYVTTTSTADSSGIVGVVKSTSCADGQYCEVITKGPADTLVLDSTDAVSTGNTIGTSSTTGYGGVFGGYDITTYGSNNILGRALEDGDGTDTGFVYVWVNPQ